MLEYAWMCLYEKDYKYVGPKYAKLWVWQSSEHGRVLSMRMVATQLSEFTRIYLGF